MNEGYTEAAAVPVPDAGDDTLRWIAFDTEFIEDGHTIDLLSIGLIRHDGATYYAEPAETDRTRASEWVAENVIPHLTGPIKPRAQIAAEIVDFAGPQPEFWAYYADYDWVALCQLYGTMMDLPDGWPMYCRDLKQYADERGWDLSQDDSDHNALGDAEWVARHVPHVLGSAGDDTLRERLAQMISDNWHGVLQRHHDGTSTLRTAAQNAADALLPRIRAHAERAVEQARADERERLCEQLDDYANARGAAIERAEKAEAALDGTETP